MKRFNLNNLKKEQPHFIGSWNIENDDLCKEIVNFFEENKTMHKQGLIGTEVDQAKKKQQILV